MTRYKFDVTGHLRDGNVVVGCQSAPLLDVVKAAEKVEVAGNSVSVTGLVADWDRQLGVYRIGGLADNRASQGDLNDYAQNREEIAPPKVWPEGTIVKTTEKFVGSSPGLRVLVGGQWLHYHEASARVRSLKMSPDADAHAKAERSLREGKWVVVHEPGAAGPYDFKPGDQVRYIESGSTTLHRGQTYTVSRVDSPAHGHDADPAYRQVRLEGQEHPGYYYAKRFEKVTG